MRPSLNSVTVPGRVVLSRFDFFIRGSYCQLDHFFSGWGGAVFFPIDETRFSLGKVKAFIFVTIVSVFIITIRSY